MSCPYLPGKTEKRVITTLAGPEAEVYHNRLTLAGYRRSHNIIYVPSCPECNACITVRVNAFAFQASKSQRRVIKNNQDLVANETVPIASEEQFSLFNRYQRGRHQDGDMASMNRDDYRALIEETPVRTSVIEFREPAENTLVAACLLDRVENGLSAVYSFFDPVLKSRGLGNYMVLWAIDYAKKQDLNYLYLGFWIKDCQKMDYKQKYQPLEQRTATGWQRFE